MTFTGRRTGGVGTVASRAVSAMVAVTVFSVLAAGCAGKPHEKQCSLELLSGESPIKTVAVMPAEFAIFRSTVKGEQELYEMSDDVSVITVEAAGQALEKNGFEVVDNGLSSGRLEDDPDLKFELTKLHGRCKEITIQTEPDLMRAYGMYRVTDTRIQNGELDIGYEVAPFADCSGADALLFVEGAGMIHSEGKQALGMAAALGGVTIIYYDQVYYRAFLVDGRDGTVLMALFGGASLDQFVNKDALPGTDGYEPGLEKLKDALTDSFASELADTLEKQPDSPAGPEQPVEGDESD